MQLEITKADKTQTIISLQPGTYSIGRAKDNDIPLDDLSVSRRHARLEVSESFQVTIVDLNSSNGSWFGDTKLKSSSWSPINNILIIGSCQLTLRNEAHALPQSPTSSPTSLVPPQKNQHHRQALAVQEVPVSKAKSPNYKRLKNIAASVFVLLIISPFLVFLCQKLLFPYTIFQKVENNQREKIQSAWLNNKNKAINVELANVQEFIANEAHEPAMGLLKNILSKDPENSQALALQKVIKQNISELNRIAQEKKQEALRKQQLQKQQIKAKTLARYKQATEKSIVEKDFLGCIQTAQKALTLAPGNDMAVTAITFCSQALADSQDNSKDAIELEKQKIESNLEKILEKGAAAVKKKRYETALGIWSKAKKIDPDKIFNTTKSIHQKASKLRRDMTKWVKENVNKGHKARENSDYIGAAKYYKRALSIKPSNKEAKQWYDDQQEENHSLAEELYHEAIAYASLDSTENATLAINKAKLLAEGDDELLDRINKIVEDFQTR